MPMILRKCTFDGCTVLTIGPRCVEHDLPVRRTFVRGRPYAGAATSPRSASVLVTRQRIVSTALIPFRRTADTFARP
jgi:hypothetical protein